MRGRTLLVTGVLLLAAPAAAHADPPIESTGWASAGSLDVLADNEHVVTGELARCDADGPATVRTPGGAAGRIAVFGFGGTVCGRNGPIAEAQAGGQRFESDFLARYGGPKLKVRTYAVNCSTTADAGSTGSMSIGEVAGFTVPSSIPANYRITVPGGPAGTALATITLNETVTPTPADGSLVTHAVHVKLFPQGGPASGDIYLGTAACNPFGKHPNVAWGAFG
ncbi:choice-of-anchor P family protein [Amycolatopsis benzoatilytica]|uniref:choice-of-anchor P family protein n=1 Tax=Amycolatopsis benzoatilytica TaxID=346045 RepID=UPI00036871F8|nr:choice-of-anchor P family protein [Amycolatopsis benzoatilytica]